MIKGMPTESATSMQPARRCGSTCGACAFQRDNADVFVYCPEARFDPFTACAAQAWMRLEMHVRIHNSACLFSAGARASLSDREEATVTLLVIFLPAQPPLHRTAANRKLENGVKWYPTPLASTSSEREQLASFTPHNSLQTTHRFTGNLACRRNPRLVGELGPKAHLHVRVCLHQSRATFAPLLYCTWATTRC